MSPGIAGILLAAGASTRMGRPKQLLPFRGTTLVRHAAQTMLASVCSPVSVVVGCESDRVRAELRGLDVTIVENPNWERGIGMSIAAGVTFLETVLPQKPAGALLMLCDQPLVTSELLDTLARALESGEYLAAGSSYGGTIGVPALFSRELFAELKLLEPASGAKAVLTRHAARVATVPFPPAATDVDTTEQHVQLNQQ